MDDYCFICYRKNEMIILDCSHSLCKKCYKNILNDVCPFCRSTFIREVERVFSVKYLYFSIKEKHLEKLRVYY